VNPWHQPRDDLRARSARQTRPRKLSAIFTELCTDLAGDLHCKGYVGRTIGIKLRYDNFRIVTRDKTIDVPTCDAGIIRRVAGECLKRVSLERRLRLLGVRIGGLSHADAGALADNRSEESTPSLFESS
jgi:DNA polymerase-4